MNATRLAVLTPAGRGAVAVVALRGPTATDSAGQYFRAANGRPLHQQPISRIVFGHWESAQGEELIVCRRSEEEVEIHCHGGPQAAKRIARQLSQLGCQQIDWQQWIAGDCPIAAEAQLALAEAQTSRAAAILLDQFDGALRKQVVAIQNKLETGDTSAAAGLLTKLLAWSPVGLHLTVPWKVVIAGRPNVGKSSLLNALAGYRRAIVFDQPGTTRDVLSVTTALEGWPVQLSDTAGLHAAADPIEQAGIARAHDQLAVADLVVWVADCSQEGWEDSASFAELASNDLVFDRSRLLVVGNKVDLRQHCASHADSHVVFTSALTGQGIEPLVQCIAERLVAHSPAPGSAVPFTSRQVGLLQTALEECERSDVGSSSSALERVI